MENSFKPSPVYGGGLGGGRRQAIADRLNDTVLAATILAASLDFIDGSVVNDQVTLARKNRHAGLAAACWRTGNFQSGRTK